MTEHTSNVVPFRKLTKELSIRDNLALIIEKIDSKEIRIRGMALILEAKIVELDEVVPLVITSGEPSIEIVRACNGVIAETLACLDDKESYDAPCDCSHCRAERGEKVLNNPIDDDDIDDDDDEYIDAQQLAAFFPWFGSRTRKKKSR